MNKVDEMGTTESPLKKLIADRDANDQGLLAEILQGHVFLDDKTLEPWLDHKARQGLPARTIILLFLAGAKASALLTGDQNKEEVAPKEIEEAVGLKGGTVRPRLLDLANEKLIEAKNGRYSILKSGVDALQESFGKMEVPF